MNFDLRSAVWMKPAFRLIVALSVFNAGCIATRHIRPGAPADELDRMNAALAGEQAKITLLQRDAVLKAENIHVSADSVSFVDIKTGAPRKITTAEIDRIIIKNHARGALEGFAGGTLAWGGFVGIALLATIGAEPVEDGPGGGILVYYVILGGSALPLLGAIVGAASGSQKMYVFNQN